jgi:hypothetical protein
MEVALLQSDAPEQLKTTPTSPMIQGMWRLASSVLKEREARSLGWAMLSSCDFVIASSPNNGHTGGSFKLSVKDLDALLKTFPTRTEK